MAKTNHNRRGLLWKLTVLDLIFLFVLYVGETLIAERHWLTTLVTYCPQQLFGLPVAILLVWSLVRKKWRILLANTAAACFFASVMLGFNIPLDAHGWNVRPSVRVMTYNIHHASRGARQIANDVREARADVVCFQEINREARKPDPVAELRKVMPRWDYRSYGQIAVFSRYPITGCKVHKPTVEFWRVFLEVNLDAGGRPLTVIDLHLSTAAEMESLTNHHGSVRSYLRGSTGARSSQIAELLGIAGRIRGPLVIAGDFNTPPRGRIYRRMARKFDDCFHSAGWGLGYTYPSNMPIMRIDYIWAGQGLVPGGCKALPLAGSDHRPVIADVIFARG